MILHTIHEVDSDKLAKVIEEMRVLGSPQLRVVDCGDYWQSIEGTHRLAAACHLQIPVSFVVLGKNDLVASDSLDMDNFCPGESYTAGEIASEICPLFELGAKSYQVGEDNRLTQLGDI